MKNISEALSERIFHTAINVNDSVEENDGNNILQVLKDEFNAITERTTKMKILTIFKE